MLLTILSIILAASSISLLIVYWKDGAKFPLFCSLSAIFGLCFIVNVVALATHPAEIRARIKKFEAAKLTIKQQRSNNLSEYERVTLTKEILERNEWLAEEQYWATNKWLNWYYDQSILNIKPIE